MPAKKQSIHGEREGIPRQVLHAGSRGGMAVQLQPQRLDHLHHRGEFGVPFGGKRLVQPFPCQTGVAGSWLMP